MVAEKGAYLLEGLRELQRRYSIIGDVDGLGLALRMEICEPHDSFTPSKAIVDRMVDEGLKGDIEVDGRSYGLVLDIGGYYKNGVTLAPSYQIRAIAGVTNDSSLTERANRSIQGRLGTNAVTTLTTIVPAFSEDYGSFEELMPGVFYFLGVSNTPKGIVGMPHSPGYVADEAAIQVGARAMAAAMVDRLAEGVRQLRP